MAESDDKYISVGIGAMATGEKVVFMELPSEIEVSDGVFEFVRSKTVLTASDVDNLIQALTAAARSIGVKIGEVPLSPHLDSAADGAAARVAGAVKRQASKHKLN